MNKAASYETFSQRPRYPWVMPVIGGLLSVVFLGIGLNIGKNSGWALFVAFSVALSTILLSIQSYRFQKLQIEQMGPRPVRQNETPHAPSFRDVLEYIPEPLMVISAREPDDLVGHRIVFANEIARSMFRIPHEGVLLVTALRAPEVLEAVDEALFGGLSRSCAYDAGGAQDRYWRALTRPMEAQADGTRLALLSLRDETDMRRMEKMRVDFLANASHELKTPLASLSGFIETLRGHAKDDPVARDRFLGIMSVQADRMRRLINDLMSLSRIELNEHIAPSGLIELGSAVSDVVDGIGPIAAQKQVKVAISHPFGLKAKVVGDRDQLLQVVQNLVDNALKYSPIDQTVEVEVLSTISVERISAGRTPGAARLHLLRPDRAEGQVYAAVRVCDHGPGIAREHLPRLTERFYRVEGQKSGDKLGTGLGLAIVKHIINRHRGGLFVESIQGEGVAFTAYFPMPGEDEAEAIEV